jgi:antitoxin (DNA-binding transcriptional repressor) of toxin-antitoxin stability system
VQVVWHKSPAAWYTDDEILSGREEDMNVLEAEKNFAKLVDKVYAEGISVDLERDDKVIARLMPAEPRSPLTVGQLNAFLRSLPSLGDDADKFAEDVRAVRGQFPTEINPWD